MATRTIYTRKQVMDMSRDELLAYFKAEGLPERLTLAHLSNAATETLRQICLMQLEDESRIKEV